MAQNSPTNGAIVLRSESNLILFLFVCSSCLNIGTVWRLHHEIHTRWTHEYENSYFARSWSRYKSKTSLQPKKLRFLQKVTRYTREGLAMAPDTITKSHPSWYFLPRSLQAGHTKATRWIHGVKMWIRYDSVRTVSLNAMRQQSY